MNAQWKRFLLQWLLPCGVFAVIMIILYASFSAKVKQEVVASYEEELVTSSSKYALTLANCVNQTEAVARTTADNINLEAENPFEALIPIYKYSFAYKAIYVREDGSAFSDTGEEIAFADLPYSSLMTGDGVKAYTFAPSDGFTGSSAFMIRTPVKDTNDFIISFLPASASEMRQVLTVEQDFDSSSFCMIMDKDGTIYGSTALTDKFAVNSVVWDDFADANNAAALRRIKTRVQSLMAGYFDVTVNGNNYLALYSPISGTNAVVMTCVGRTSIDKNEDRLYSANVKRLTWMLMLMALFIVAVSVINIVQIFASSKDTEELKDKADTDQLTGLKNKLATEREIKEYIEDHPDTIGMMFMIDIDNFKKINDTMGHAFGDEVLRELGRNIGINFRVSDIIGRTGGDEFTIFLKNLKEDANTLREAQKLVYFFKHFQVGDYVKYTVTASIGAAVFPEHGADFETLYKAADAAVYKSKKRGKNQLSFYDDRDRTPEEVAEADSHLIDIERKEETPIESN